jgi:hypothetical protein
MLQISSQSKLRLSYCLASSRLSSIGQLPNRVAAPKTELLDDSENFWAKICEAAS